MRALASVAPAKSEYGWHNLYQAALFETDRSQVPLRIAQAEQAIFARMRELLIATDDHIEEDQILDDSLYALGALRNCAVGEITASQPSACGNGLDALRISLNA